jgi:PST family polysaccharide transporter
MFDKIKNVSNNRQVKLLLENFVSLSALELVGIVMPLITLPYVLRVIGLEKYGLIALATALITYFMPLVDFSFRITATRDVAVFKASHMKLNIIYSQVMMVKFIFLLLSLLLMILTIILLPPFTNEKLLFLYAGLGLIGYMLFPEWFFQGIEQMKYITIINVVVKIIFALSVFVFITEESDYVIYPLMTSVGLILSGIAAQIILFRKYKLRLHFIPIYKLKRVMLKNVPIFVNQFMPNLYNNSVPFLLGLISGPAHLGIYSVIRKIISLAETFITVVSRVFFPYINNKRNAFYIYRKIMYAFGITCIIGILSLNKIIFWYLDINDTSAIWILGLLSLSILGLVTSNIYGLNYFIVIRQDKLVMRNTIAASILGFIISFPFIYFLNAIGGALSLMISRFLMGGGLLIKYISMNNKIGEGDTTYELNK